jgi:hypothetical protein
MKLSHEFYEIHFVDESGVNNGKRIGKQLVPYYLKLCMQGIYELVSIAPAGTLKQCRSVKGMLV